MKISVYRIEDNNGRGPWGSLSCNVADDKEDEFWRTLREVGININPIWEDCPNFLHGIHLCAFDNLSMTIDMFAPIFHLLKQYSWRIAEYQIDDKHAIINRRSHQVAFEKEATELKEYIPV